MKRGTKSLLFGVHHVLIHPFVVWLAWCRLYGLPSWRECICILIHDWGYWGCPDMDGDEGERHPKLGADVAYVLFGRDYYKLCLYHSRHYARWRFREPSKLCYADKLSIAYEPAWFYLLRARLSGELLEYRRLAAVAGFIPLAATDREWFFWVQDRLATIGRSGRADAVPYVNPERSEER